jgi:hypothetical protein
MPETRDWSAPPQTRIITHHDSDSALETEQDRQIVAGTPGREMVIVGWDLTGVPEQQSPPGQVGLGLRSLIWVALLDVDDSSVIATATLSPAAPTVTLRPPFGSLRVTVGSDLDLRFGSALGGGTQHFTTNLYYYLE